MKIFARREPIFFGIPAFLIAILGQKWPVWLVAIVEKKSNLRDEVWKG